LFLAQTARQVTDLDHVITGGCKSDMDGMPYYWFPPEGNPDQSMSRHTLEWTVGANEPFSV
jgi:hypothetical protein